MTGLGALHWRLFRLVHLRQPMDDGSRQSLDSDWPGTSPTTCFWSSIPAWIPVPRPEWALQVGQKTGRTYPEPWHDTQEEAGNAWKKESHFSTISVKWELRIQNKGEMQHKDRYFPGTQTPSALLGSLHRSSTRENIYCPHFRGGNGSSKTSMTRGSLAQ